ncbi:uncharacterized protein RCO7_01550 [Rhynchosporium graminicola]|uniref:Uncharacterized protein n=1 Tax=Rhynchosporium graminicola TaxID=2792576 RepID=A0A1E1JZK1_9HELO|nr:uncharacterized protein RCO7_01550 [Rhynchosporium commune]
MPGRDPTTHIYAGLEDVIGPVVDDRVETMFWSSIPLRTVDSVLNCSLLCLVLVLVLSPLWSAQLFRKPFPIISGIWSHLLYKSFLALFWNDGGWSVIWLQVLLPNFVMVILIAVFGVFLGGALDAEERTEWIDCLELFAGSKKRACILSSTPSQLHFTKTNVIKAFQGIIRALRKSKPRYEHRCKKEVADQNKLDYQL